MPFVPTDISFDPGLYGNRSKRASKGRWVDGNLVRFRDGVPAQVGGWTAPPHVGGPIIGRARDMIAWRPNNQASRNCAIGTHTNVYLFDGGAITDITPDSFEPGRADSILGAGYGAGLYGTSTYGTPRAVGSTLLDAATWTFAMFGDILIACYSGSGVIYRYQIGTDTKLVPLTNAPTAHAICVSDERHIFAFGCDGDPTLVMWCDREQPTVWAPLATNRAGSYNVASTSSFQNGKQVRGAVLGWTQTELFGFSPLNNSLVYSRDRLASNCGAMGPHSMAVVTDQSGDVAYWMGSSSFWIYDGAVRKLPCELQDYVFKDINLIQRAKCFAATNVTYGEIWFFYCSSTSNEVDRAVTYSYETQTWSKATVGRLAWCDVGIFPLPLAVDAFGTLYEHESGDLAAGEAMDSYVLSYPLTIGSGSQMLQILDFTPDMEPMSGACDLTLIGRYYAGAPDELFGPYRFDTSIEKIDLALELRQVQIRLAGTGAYWELGLPTLRFQPGSER